MLECFCCECLFFSHLAVVAVVSRCFNSFLHLEMRLQIVYCGLCTVCLWLCVCVSVCTVHVARIVFLVIVFALIVIAVVIMIVVIFRIVVLVDGSTSAFGCGGGCHHSCGLESTCTSICFFSFVLVQCKGLYIHIRLQMLMNRVR